MKILSFNTALKITYLLLSINFAMVINARAQDNFSFTDGFVTHNSLKGASIGLVVSDLSTGKILMDVNPDLLLAPASVVKLVTSAVALETLGPAWRFETGLGYRGILNKQTGLLKGDIVITGGGDPATGSVWYNTQRSIPDISQEWVEKVKENGIREITGDIIVDISGFERWALPPKWAWEDIGNYYGTSASALNIYDNSLSLYFRSPPRAGELTTITGTFPNVEGIDFINEVRSSVVNRDLAYVYGSPWDAKRLIKGTIPLNRSNFEVRASLPDPPNVFGCLLKDWLTLAGIDVGGEVKLVTGKAEATELHTFYSPPLSEICSVFNHQSVNLIGEALVMQMAYNFEGFGSHKNGLDIINSFMKEQAIAENYFLEDGSGMSRFNALSAHQFNNLLQYMHRSAHGRVFKSTLPVAGSGTLRNFNTQKFPGNTLRCKSGTMTRVRAYAGYLVCTSGREVAFTVIVNNFEGTQQEVFRLMEDFLSEVRNSL